MRFRSSFIIHRSSLQCLIAVGVVFASSSPYGVWACDVPVFRYALERWPAAPYRLVVLHRGPLAAEEQEIVEQLSDASIEEIPYSNFEVQLADLAAQPDALLERFWNQAGSPPLPCMILLYPPEERIGGAVWSGRLTMNNASVLVDSPVRREVAKRLLEGHSAVWVLLECGDSEKDTSAKAFLQSHLEQMEQILELPAAVRGTLARETEPIVATTPPLQIRFSLLTLSRTDPAESALVAMLLHSEGDLFQYSAFPLAFPVFGRGRALYALVGKGITGANIGEACRFLVGPCSCQAKALNPGTDLLIVADWDAGLAGSIVEALESQLVLGLAKGALLRNMLVALALIVLVVAFLAVRIARQTAKHQL